MSVRGGDTLRTDQYYVNPGVSTILDSYRTGGTAGDILQNKSDCSIGESSTAMYGNLPSKRMIKSRNLVKLAEIANLTSSVGKPSGVFTPQYSQHNWFGSDQNFVNNQR